jgi:putative mycofactocin binding protein MftB
MPTELTDRHLVLHPRVALRPEPFGALAYHYGTRRLVFLKHPDMLRVVRSLSPDTTVGEALTAGGIDRARWPRFVTALQSLVDSEMLTQADE